LSISSLFPSYHAPIDNRRQRDYICVKVKNIEECAFDFIGNKGKTLIKMSIVHISNYELTQKITVKRIFSRRFTLKGDFNTLYWSKSHILHWRGDTVVTYV